MSYTRFALYYVPPEGDLASFGASWLGWDIISGAPACEKYEVAGLAEATAAPRKYGFHGTLKPPFALREGMSLAQLQAACATLAAQLSPATCEGLEVTALGRFLALTPRGDAGAIARVAAACVSDLDGFRAPANAEERAKRRKARLTPEQDALLLRWGYPYVMEAFRFHMTLTGRGARAQVAAWRNALEAHLPDMPAPFCMDQIALAGERADGHFELVARYRLTG